MRDEQRNTSRHGGDDYRHNVDPAPEKTPDLEAGGGVSPGDTPPESPQTSGLSHEQPPMTKHFPAGGVWALAGAALLIIAMIVVVVGIIVMMV